MNTCFPENETTEELRLTEDEVVALFMNMIAFDGDWDAHLDFLNLLDEEMAWKKDQISTVQELRNMDQTHGIQSTIEKV